MGKINVAIILPTEELYSSYYGGALARWTHKVYSQFDDIDFKVFAKTCGTKFAYTDPIFKHPFLRFVHWIEKNVVSKILPKREGYLWVLTSYLVIRKYDVLHVFNRAHYVLLFRKLGYTKPIILHLQNFQVKDESAVFFSRVLTKSSHLLWLVATL